MVIFEKLGKKNRWKVIWNGHASVRSGIISLLWAVLRIIFASWLWGTAMRLAHFQPPTKSIAVALALGSMLLVIWALRGFGHAFLALGFKRCAISITLAFILLVIINVLTVPDTRPVSSRFVTHVSAITEQIWNTLSNWSKSAIQAPDNFLFAYSGQRKSPPIPPGFPTPNPNATPVQASAIGRDNPPVRIPTPLLNAADIETSPIQITSDETLVSSFKIGDYVQVANTGGQPLRARAEPGTDKDIVARFPAGARLHILDGPRLRDSFNWWKVQSDEGEEGWCVDHWLEPIVE